MRKRFLLFALLLIAAAVSFWHLSTPGMSNVSPQEPAPDIGVTDGKTAPQFTLNNLAGASVLVGKPGKVTVINFWATWCPPCKAEMPELNVFAQKHKESVAFYAVNLQEPRENVQSFMERNNYSIPVLLDSDGKAGSLYGVRVIPTTIILDKNGVVKFRKSGTVTERELESVIKSL